VSSSSAHLFFYLSFCFRLVLDVAGMFSFKVKNFLLFRLFNFIVHLFFYGEF